MVLEIHVQILTSSRLSAITGTGDKMGADTPAPRPEGFGVQRINFLIGKEAPPFVHRHHETNVAASRGKN